MKLEAVIGLEIHVQLNTKSKMFCSCPNIFGDVEPNTAVCPICLGHPGTLPVPNKQAIEWTQKTGMALGCDIATDSKFDRKSYFYPDLPKGYQISQYDKPFCQHGKVEILVEDEKRTIGITRIHLEEDAAKNTHPRGANYTLVDYNRAGTPLMEIVSEPDIRSPQEAKIFLQELQRIVRSIGVSDADMEKGQMRCDANISLREVGSTELHPKTEVKNINSFKFVEKALEYEIERQTKLWEEGTIPNHATRGWKSDTGKTVEQRTKEEAADYRYFPDPDITPFEFTEDVLQEVRATLSELPQEKRERFMKQYGVSSEHAEILTSEKTLGYLFEDTVSEIQQADKERVDVSSEQVANLVRLAATTILREVRDIVRTEKLTYEDLKITPENLAEVIILVHEGKMNRNAVQKVLEEMQKTGGDPDAILQNLGLEQVSVEGDLEQYIDAVISENAEIVEKIRSGKGSAIQFLMGQVMAKSGGKANPAVVVAMLKKKILGE